MFRSYWPMLLFGLSTVFIGNYGQSFFISWYGAAIQDQLGLTAAAYGSAYSGATLVSGLMIMAFGGLVDRVPLRGFIAAVVAGLTLAAVLMWQVQSYVSLVIALFLLRFCGQGLMPHTAMTAMGRYFSVSRGKAIGVATNGVPLGEIILPTLAVALIALFGWQGSWGVIALFIPLVYLPLAFWLIGRAGPSEIATLGDVRTDRAEDEPDGSRRTLLADYRFWLALPMLIAQPFIVTGLFIHQGYFLAEKDWSSALFASSFIAYGGAHWISAIITGSLVDRFTATRLMKFIGLPIGGALLLGSALDGAWVVYLMMTVLGIGVGMAGTVMNAIWAEVYGTAHLGSIRALFTSMMILSTSASPIILGFAIDGGASAPTLMFAMGIYPLIAVVLACFSFKVRTAGAHA